MQHDLTTTAGVFGYFAEHTKILDPVKAEFEKLGAENAQLKKDKETFEQAILELTMLVGGMPGGA